MEKIKREEFINSTKAVEGYAKEFDASIPCPVCHNSAIVNGSDLVDGEVEFMCECKQCGIAYSVWYKLEYVCHSGVIDLDEE